MEERIIEAARAVCKTDFMQYPDYDETIEMTLADAVTILIAENMPDEPTENIYEFLSEKFGD